MNDLYKEKIIDHYRNPRNFGDLSGATVKVREANASCGDMIELALKFKVQDLKGKVIEDIRFKGIGCAISTAAASLLTEAVKGKTVKRIKEMTDKKAVGMLGIKVSPGRVRCLMLPWRALQKAVEATDEHQ
jgi:nitrogen fixation NifU-like protein